MIREHEGYFGSLRYARNTSADHMPFVSGEIPGFRFIQDPIDYEPRTHHTSLDVGGLDLKDDPKPASTVVASALYHGANRPELLPRRPLPPPHGKKPN